MNKWDSYFVELSMVAAKLSKDTSTKLGCVIVGPDHEVRSTGYNSFPRGVNDNVVERHERPLKYKWFEHAERNAIFNAARIGVSTKGCTLYCAWPPCTDCARAIIQAGIVEVVVETEFPAVRWNESMDRGEIMLSEAGVKMRRMEKRPPRPRRKAGAVLAKG